LEIIRIILASSRVEADVRTCHDSHAFHGIAYSAHSAITIPEVQWEWIWEITFNGKNPGGIFWKLMHIKNCGL
jgi:hypothetical protein